MTATDRRDNILDAVAILTRRNNRHETSARIMSTTIPMLNEWLGNPYYLNSDVTALIADGRLDSHMTTFMGTSRIAVSLPRFPRLA